jgi:hypothetical protein
MSMGYLLYQPDPEEVLEPVQLSGIHPHRDARYWEGRAAELALPPLGPLSHRLQQSSPLRFAYTGDRAALAECLIGTLSPESVRCLSFSTSLIPSSTRPFVLSLVGGDCAPGFGKLAHSRIP